MALPEAPVQQKPGITAPATTPAPAGDTPTTQNGQKTGSEVIDDLPDDLLDAVTGNLKTHMPKGSALDEARGKARADAERKAAVVNGKPPEEAEATETPPAPDPLNPQPGDAENPPAPQEGEKTAEQLEADRAAAEQAESERQAQEEQAEREREAAEAAAGKLPQQRLRPTTPEDALTLQIYRQRQDKGNPISMVEAALEAGRILNPDGAEEHKPAKTIADAEAELTQLESDLKAAGEAYDGPKQTELMLAMRAKDREIAGLREQDRQRQQQEANKVNGAYAASMNEAVKLYPGLLVKGSEIEKLKTDIHARMVAANDPNVGTADYPLYLARLAAKEALVAPAKIENGKPAAAPTAPSKPVIPARSVQPAKPAPPIASGSARTTQPTAGQSVDAKLDRMTDREIDEVTAALYSLQKR